MEVELGGRRQGSGEKIAIDAHNYERSTHNISKVFRSSMATGVLVPCYNNIALPGSNWEIDLSAMVMTNPTVGMLMGSFKFQIDVFTTPLRLWNRQIMYNSQGIGLRMQDVKFPVAVLEARSLKRSDFNDNMQINQSSVFAYLGLRGLGQDRLHPDTTNAVRTINACSLLTYYDTAYNYYCNKQEGFGFQIHNPMLPISAYNNHYPSSAILSHHTCCHP